MAVNLKSQSQKMSTQSSLQIRKSFPTLLPATEVQDKSQHLFVVSKVNGLINVNFVTNNNT